MKNELRDFNKEQLMYLKETNLLNKKEIDNLWNRYLKNDSRIPWSRIWPFVVLGHWMKQNAVSV